MVAVLLVFTSVSIYDYDTRPCTPGGEPSLSGVRYCAPPSGPQPTTVIANGTVFTASVAQPYYFQFQLSPASFAELSGNFTSALDAAVLVMTPAHFSDFEADDSLGRSCAPENGCYTTGEIPGGAVNITNLPVYDNQHEGRSVVTPWFLVVQVSGGSATTNVTWVSGLVATHVDLIA